MGRLEDGRGRGSEWEEGGESRTDGGDELDSVDDGEVTVENGAAERVVNWEMWEKTAGRNDRVVLFHPLGTYLYLFD